MRSKRARLAGASVQNADPPHLTDKVVGLIATAGGVQGPQTINAMEFAVRSLRGYTHPLTAPIDRAWQLFDKSGNFSDEATIARLRTLGQGVASAARRLGLPAPLLTPRVPMVTVLQEPMRLYDFAWPERFHPARVDMAYSVILTAQSGRWPTAGHAACAGNQLHPVASRRPDSGSRSSG